MKIPLIGKLSKQFDRACKRHTKGTQPIVDFFTGRPTLEVLPAYAYATVSGSKTRNTEKSLKAPRFYQATADNTGEGLSHEGSPTKYTGYNDSYYNTPEGIKEREEAIKQQARNVQNFLNNPEVSQEAKNIVLGIEGGDFNESETPEESTDIPTSPGSEIFIISTINDAQTRILELRRMNLHLQMRNVQNFLNNPNVPQEAKNIVIGIPSSDMEGRTVNDTQADSKINPKPVDWEAIRNGVKRPTTNTEIQPPFEGQEKPNPEPTVRIDCQEVVAFPQEEEETNPAIEEQEPKIKQRGTDIQNIGV
jgi:hypothetical protein